jgi:hypothetical protein
MLLYLRKPHGHTTTKLPRIPFTRDILLARRILPQNTAHLQQSARRTHSSFNASRLAEHMAIRYQLCISTSKMPSASGRSALFSYDTVHYYLHAG